MCRSSSFPRRPPGSPILLKPYPGLLGASGTIVLIDSDMIVTRSLAEIAALAARRADLRLSRPLAAPRPLVRRVGAGAGAARSPAAADVPECGLPRALDRPLARSARPLVGALRAESRATQLFGRFEQPFWAGDQDVLNAILASEIPEEALAELPEDGRGLSRRAARGRGRRRAHPALRAPRAADHDSPLLARPEGLGAQGLGPPPRRRLRSAPAPAPLRGRRRRAAGAEVGSRLAAARRFGRGLSSAAPTWRTAASAVPCTPCPVRFATGRSRYETRSSADSRRPASSSWSAAPLISEKGRPERSAIAFRSWRRRRGSAPRAARPRRTSRRRPRGRGRASRAAALLWGSG